MNIYTIYVFIIVMAGFMIIGLRATNKTANTRKDYYLASNKISPLAVGLSAFSTNHSGFMFTGLVAYTYYNGLAAVWIILPWMLGDVLATSIFIRRIYGLGRGKKSITFIDNIVKYKDQVFTYFRILLSLVLLILLIFVASSQLKASGIAISSIVTINGTWAILIATIIVLTYTFYGGMRASIWTDVSQSVIMIISATTVALVGAWLLYKSGEYANLAHASHVPKNFLDFKTQEAPLNTFIGIAVFCIGYVTGGFCVIGAPHVINRYMSLNSPKGLIAARVVYYIAYVFFSAMVIAIGIIARILIQDPSDPHAESVIFDLSKQILHPAAVGLIAAGMFAATISTVDSIVLVCSGIISRDLPGRDTSASIKQLGTILSLGAAFAIALLNNATIFKTVYSAGAVMGGSITPILILYLLKKPLNESLLLTMFICSSLTSALWSLSSLNNYLFGALPGIIVSCLVYFVYSAFHNKNKSEKIC